MSRPIIPEEVRMDTAKCIEKAAALYCEKEHEFHSKAAQKEAMRYLNRAYSAMRSANLKAAVDRCIESGWEPEDPRRKRELQDRELPNELHHYHPEKHDRAWIDAEHWELANQLAGLRELYRRAWVRARAEDSPETALRKQEQAVSIALGDGFRPLGITAQHWYCANERGTHWYRRDWYYNGERTSFSSVSKLIEKYYRFWEANGRPDMSGMDLGQIREFYKGVA